MTYMHSHDATLLSKTVCIQLLSRRGMSNMLDTKDKLRGQIVADEPCRDVYAGTPSSPTSRVVTCMPVHPRRRRAVS